MLLGRYAFDGDRLERSGLFEYVNRGNKIKSVKYPYLNITFMTVHSSKGLGYDDVIIINGKNETYGFPSKIEDDPVLAFVIRGDKSIEYAEERRLFYVAMTRTKNRVFCIAPEQNPSEFLLEIKRDYKNVILHGEWNEEEPQQYQTKVCPLCGYPMQLKYKKAYGLRLYICTNEPEICGFMTNDCRGGKLAIQKCDRCKDGYLIIKPNKSNGFFLGCTNYKPDGTGCNNAVSKKQYYTRMGYSADTEKKELSEVRNQPNTTLKKSDIKNNGYLSEEKNSENMQQPNDYVKIEKAKLSSGCYYEGWELNTVVYDILCGLQEVSKVRYYGIWMLVDVLHGIENKKIFDNRLDRLSCFGSYRNMSKETIHTVIEWLIKEHYILKTKGQYPVLHSTHEGLHYCESITENKLKRLKKCLEENIVL